MMSIREFVKSFTTERWTLGFVQNSIQGILGGEELKIEWVRTTFKDKWFADPFILDVTDSHIILLVEEFTKKTNRGRISRLTVNRDNYVIEKVELVKELPTHMSFPFIIRESWLKNEKLDNNEVLIMPENGASGHLTVYKYNIDQNALQPLRSVLDEDVADAVPIKIRGIQYLFCTKAPKANGDTLYIYRWDERKGLFEICGSKRFNENLARMGGSFFQHGEKIYRVAQECNIQYGHAVTLQEVIINNTVRTVDSISEYIEFKEVCRFISNNPQYEAGMHTFNMYKNYIVVDALGFENMWVRKVLKFFKILH